MGTRTTLGIVVLAYILAGCAGHELTTNGQAEKLCRENCTSVDFECEPGCVCGDGIEQVQCY